MTRFHQVFSRGSCSNTNAHQTRVRLGRVRPGALPLVRKAHVSDPCPWPPDPLTALPISALLFTSATGRSQAPLLFCSLHLDLSCSRHPGGSRPPLCACHLLSPIHALNESARPLHLVLLSSTVFTTIRPVCGCNPRAQNRAWHTTVTWMKRMLPGHLIQSPLKSPFHWLGALSAHRSSPISVTAYSAATQMLDGPRTENLYLLCDGWTSVSHKPSLQMLTAPLARGGRVTYSRAFQAVTCM